MAVRLLRQGENPRHKIVRHIKFNNTYGREFIGRVKDVNEDGTLKVQHFCGDWWSFNPKPEDVAVLEPDESDYEEGDE